jgi:signal transduction histidine kinase
MEPTEHPERNAAALRSDTRRAAAARSAEPAADSAASPADDVAAAIRSYLSVLEGSDEGHDGATNEYLALEETARIVAREKDAARLLAGCFKKAATFLDLDLLRLFRLDPRRGELRLVGGHGSVSASTDEASLSRSLEPFRKNGRHHRGPVAVEEVLTGRGSGNGGSVALTVLSVPILEEGKLWGVLQAGAAAPRRLSASESRAIESIASLIGVAMFRIEETERSAALQAKLQRKSARILDLYGRLREVRSDLQEKNRALADALSNLKEIEKMKDAFVSSISHEMRTPLTIIRSYLDLLLNYRPDTRDKEVEFLKVVDGEATKLIAQINKILHLTEIQGNEVRLQIEPHDTEDLVRSAIAEVEGDALAKEIRIERRLAAALPKLLVDRSKAIQVLVDLLDNGIKFSPGGSLVTIGAREAPGDLAGPYVTLWVADEGPGIEPEDTLKIFEQFVQVAKTATGKPRGIGLGLPICKAYIERMNGRMWVESESGSGSTFFVSLPATDTSPAA